MLGSLRKKLETITNKGLEQLQILNGQHFLVHCIQVYMKRLTKHTTVTGNERL